MSPSELVEATITKYLSSHDFNGLPIAGLDDTPENRSMVSELIRGRQLDLVRGDVHPNPHIKAFAAEPVADQVRKIGEQGLGHGCLYPTVELLKVRKVGQAFADRPFSKMLAEGAGQIEFCAFDLRLLEYYRNDPRFEYRVDDVMGSIYRRAEHREDTPATVSDEIELARFGFAYDDDFNRAVALLNRDLSGFEPEQQQYMGTMLLKGSRRFPTDAPRGHLPIWTMHPGFYQSAVVGDWSEYVSIYDAFLEEKQHVNAMCSLMGKPPLFKANTAYPRPHGFGILLRPTRKEFRDFVLQLDQLLSDDLNVEFFKEDMAVTEEVTMADGTVRNQRIGTITLLQRWLARRFHVNDGDDLADLFKKLRRLRDLRAKPAHVAEDNTFDQAFVRQQKELIQNGFFIVRTLRMIFENHPAVRGYEIPSYLRNPKVWSM